MPVPHRTRRPQSSWQISASQRRPGPQHTPPQRSLSAQQKPPAQCCPSGQHVPLHEGCPLGQVPVSLSWGWVSCCVGISCSLASTLLASWPLSVVVVAALHALRRKKARARSPRLPRRNDGGCFMQVMVSVQNGVVQVGRVGLGCFVVLGWGKWLRPVFAVAGQGGGSTLAFLGRSEHVFALPSEVPRVWWTSEDDRSSICCPGHSGVSWRVTKG